MWDLPGSGIKPVSPALASGFLTTGPPGKSSTCVFLEEIHFVVVVQVLSHGQLFVTSRTAACQASLSFTVSQSLLKLMSIESVMSSNHLILCCLLLLLPSIFPRFRVFFNELALHFRWPKYWSFSISPFVEYSGLISFRMDWFDPLAVHIVIVA